MTTQTRQRKQANPAGRLNLFWPLALIVIAVFWLIAATGALPPAVIDLALRSWPVAFIALGLILLLSRRVRFGNMIALIVCGVLVGALIVLAYNQQSTRLSTAYQILDNEPKPQLGPDVKSVNISITSLTTQIEIDPADPALHVLTVHFQGSQESRAALNYAQDGEAGTYTYIETPANAIPMLEAVGKGKLTVQLPAGVIINQLTINGREGDLTFDSSTSTINRLSVSMGSGNITAKLGDKPGLIGDFKTGRGDVSVVVPKTLIAQFQLLGGGASNPVFNAADYLITRDNFLKAQRDPNNPQITITITTDGKISVQ